MRKQTWTEDLADYLRQSGEKKFEWGVHDCSTFAAGAVEVMTGRHINVPDFEQVRDANAAIRALLRKSLRLRVTEILGRSVDVKQARRGDIILSCYDDREALGVCFGEFSFFLLEQGIAPLKTLDCVCAWSVD